MSTSPDSPISQMLAGAIQMHEMLVAYVEAGFTRAEAMEILKTMVAEQVRNEIGRR
ncbi:hypothetical protein ACTXL8_05455 [Glutamicibacter arilaitensis]|uniref:hypothetical protein n=1 Tax=Glutamicibacter arilaitensis TaxID=256701 RepID=UPI003FB75657